jgi:hypothetical protein
MSNDRANLEEILYSGWEMNFGYCNYGGGRASSLAL